MKSLSWRLDPYCTQRSARQEGSAGPWGGARGWYRLGCCRRQPGLAATTEPVLGTAEDTAPSSPDVPDKSCCQVPCACSCSHSSVSGCHPPSNEQGGSSQFVEESLQTQLAAWNGAGRFPKGSCAAGEHSWACRGEQGVQGITGRR